MFNLFDILQSQAGPGMQSIGQQFGLTPEQSRNAMNALLPALATGLQHSAASDPMGFGRMLGMVGSNPYFGAQSRPQPAPEPDLFGQIFGSPMLSQAVLQQASSASGIGQQALRQMLPVMAGMVVTGIVHVLVNQPPPAIAPVQHRTSTPDNGLSVATFWNDWVNQMIGAFPPGSTNASGTPSKPHEKTPPRQASSARAPAPRDGGASDASMDAFQQMFQTGVQVQEQNAKAMRDIFESFWSQPAGPTVTSGEIRNSVSGPSTPTDAAKRRRSSRSEER